MHTASSEKASIAVTFPFTHQIDQDLNVFQAASGRCSQSPELNRAILLASVDNLKSDPNPNCDVTSEVTSNNCLFRTETDSLVSASEENKICHIMSCTGTGKFQSHPPLSQKNLSMSLIDISKRNFTSDHMTTSNDKDNHAHLGSLQQLTTENGGIMIACKKPQKSVNNHEIQGGNNSPVRLLHISNRSSNMEYQPFHTSDSVFNDELADCGIPLYLPDMYECSSLVSEDTFEEPSQQIDCRMRCNVDSNSFLKSSNSDVNAAHSVTTPLIERGDLNSPCSSNESGYYGYHYLIS